MLVLHPSRDDGRKHSCSQGYRCPGKNIYNGQECIETLWLPGNSRCWHRCNLLCCYCAAAAAALLLQQVTPSSSRPAPCRAPSSSSSTRIRSGNLGNMEKSFFGEVCHSQQQCLLLPLLAQAAERHAVTRSRAGEMVCPTCTDGTLIDLTCRTLVPATPHRERLAATLGRRSS